MLNFTIQSHKGPYLVEFNNNLINSNILNNLGTHYIIDKNVLSLLGKNFYSNLDNKICIVIEALEDTKSYTGIVPILDELIKHKLQRDSHLVAIGGGITQDITCFVANTFMRGIDWTFVPTTLLAQADSCIGSKSSINFGNTKNILGSFTPPKRVIISEEFLNSLPEKEIQSGLGEIIKLYFVNNQNVDAATIKTNLSHHLYNTLQIKRRFIEQDEFDKGIRNILNYGHCFGHAIESATNFEIPHGIAVAMGMEIANMISLHSTYINQNQYASMKQILTELYNDYKNVSISIENVLSALGKDKKNTSGKINVILFKNDSLVKHGFENNSTSLNFFKDVLNKSDFIFID